MGFWGTFVVHRDEQLLWDLLPEVAALQDAELCREDGRNGWQVTRVFAMPHDLPRSFLEDLRELTGKPVLAATVLDSDAAIVRAVGAGTSGWQTWLNREKAVDYVADGHRFDGDQEERREAARRHILAETDPQDRAARAVAWAAEAGWASASVAQVAAVVASEETFVEDVLFTLLERLGLQTQSVEAPERPSFVELLSEVTGRRLDAVESSAHQLLRGERLSFPDMRDIRLHFDGYPTLTACGCQREFGLFPNTLNGIAAGGPGGSSGQKISEVLANMLGRELTAATTVRYRLLPDVKGVVLRFGADDVFLAAVDGQWVIEGGATVPPQLAGYASHGPDDLHVNPWITS